MGVVNRARERTETIEELYERAEAASLELSQIKKKHYEMIEHQTQMNAKIASYENELRNIYEAVNSKKLGFLHILFSRFFNSQ